jgi:hypothetical protein
VNPLKDYLRELKCFENQFAAYIDFSLCNLNPNSYVESRSLTIRSAANFIFLFKDTAKKKPLQITTLLA